MTRQEIKDYLIYEADYSEETVEHMTPFQLVDAYFTYNGIIGYTEEFIDVTLHAFGFLAHNEDVEDLIY